MRTSLHFLVSTCSNPLHSQIVRKYTMGFLIASTERPLCSVFRLSRYGRILCRAIRISSRTPSAQRFPKIGYLLTSCLSSFEVPRLAQACDFELHYWRFSAMAIRHVSQNLLFSAAHIHREPKSSADGGQANNYETEASGKRCYTGKTYVWDNISLTNVIAQTVSYKHAATFIIINSGIRTSWPTHTGRLKRNEPSLIYAGLVHGFLTFLRLPMHREMTHVSHTIYLNPRRPHRRRV